MGNLFDSPFVRLGLLAVGLVLGGYLLRGVVGGGSGEGGDAPHSKTGCSASRRAVEERLRSPATAKMIDCSSTTSAGVQTVLVTIDAQNAFGAAVRTQWVAKVRDNTVESVTQIR